MSGPVIADIATAASVDEQPLPVTPTPAVPPTASFIYAPASPVAGQPVLFDGTGSSCPDAPCTYAWSDDGEPTQPSEPVWPLGSGQTLLFTFSEAGTKYVRLVVTDAAGQTATVEHNVVVEASESPPPPPAPTNTVLPSVSGSAVEGERLTASNGIWTGSPSSYSYRWQDCDTSGESCSSISGASASSYRLVATDVGHTIRIVVTASNAGGATAATSAPTAVVGSESVSCSKTLKPSEKAAELESQIEGATSGHTVCFATGKYDERIELSGPEGHPSYVTLRPALGANPEFFGMSLTDASYLRIEKLKFVGKLGAVTKGSETGREQQGGNTEMFGSENIEWLEDSWEDMEHGAALRESEGKPTRKVVFENDYMYNAEFGEVKNEASGENIPFGCNSGLFHGEDIVMPDASEVAIRHDTFFLTDGHYIQGGTDVAIEHDLFEGDNPYGCQHVNVWQVFMGGENLTFSDNIVYGRGRGGGNGPHGTGSEEASSNALLFQNGGNSSECTNVTMTNAVLENNVFVNGGGQAFQTQGIESESVKHNTVVGSGGVGYSIGGYACTPTNLVFEENIGVETGGPSFSVNGSGVGFKCDKNVSEDETAKNAAAACESSSHVVGWTPSWESSSWNPIAETEAGNHFPKPPKGWYVPTAGSVAFAAGYEGGGGP